MSHWQSGKLTLKCSMSVLKKALLNIMPEWEAHLREDPNGKLTIKSGYNQPEQHGYHLAIPMNQSTGVSGADMGFKQNEDGSWSIKYDYLPTKLRHPQGQIVQEVAAMKVKLIASKTRGVRVTSDETIDGERVIELIVPEDGVKNNYMA
jgi:hypothetical protein